MDKAGFIGLISEKNKLSGLFRSDIDVNQLGFARLNDYFSEILFPGISTLMPNMVYCYMIFSLIKYFEEENKDDTEINDLLGQITEYEYVDGSLGGSGKTSLVKKNKGFHREGVKENIMGTYRRFMERYYFNSNIKIKELNDKYLNNNKSRYSKVIRIIKSPDVGIELGNSNYTWENLDSLEKNDLKKRCLINLGFDIDTELDIKNKKKDEIKKILNESRSNDDSTDYSLIDFIIYKKILKKEDDSGIPLFEELGIYFDEDDKKEDSPFYSLYRCYHAARFTSIVEYYVKCRCNELLDKEKETLYGNTLGEEEANAINNLKKYITDDGQLKDLPFVEKEDILKTVDDNCKEGIGTLWDIYEKVKNGENCYDADRLIWNSFYKSEGGNETGWNRSRITEYHDTFRWEYRPEDSEKKAREAGRNTKCASYFVNEIMGNNANGR